MRNKGFTLIELMIVITVIAILAGIVLFGLGAAQKNARDVQRQQIVKAVQVAIQSYSSSFAGAIPTGDSGSGATWPNLTYVGSDTAPASTTTVRLGMTYLPTPLIDPGCGSSSGGDVRGGYYPSNNHPVGCPTVSYLYRTTGLSTKCTGAEYEIELVKEAGGSLFFCGPR